MATKLDTEKPIFMGKTPVREGTVVDAMRQAVRDLDKGEGVSYAELEKHLLDNFTPNKSASYGPSYIKSYVRDGIHKYDHLSHDNGGHEYEAITPAPKAEAKPKKLTKADQSEVEYLGFIRKAGEVEDAGDIDQTTIAIDDMVQGTNRKTKTIETNVAKLEEKGFLRTEEREGNEEGTTVTYVFLTEAGLARLEELEARAAELEESNDSDSSGE